MKSKKIVAAGAFLLSLALAACSRPPTETDPLPRVLVVRAGSLNGVSLGMDQPEGTSPGNAIDNPGTADGDQIFPASLLARHEVTLGFRTGGRVLTRRVEVGSRVSAEQVLGTLDAADYQINAALAGDQQRAASVELEQAERDAARFGRLGGEGAMPTAEQERQRARADANAQKVQEAVHQAALAQRRVGYTELRAPFAGVITQSQFEPGLVVPEGQAVLTLADPTQQDVVADLPEQLAARLSYLQLSASLPGQATSAAQVALRVREVAPQANPLGRTVRVRLTPAGPITPARRQLQGLGRSVDLHVREATPASANGAALKGGAIDLPAAALVQTSAGPFVYVLEPSADKAVGQNVLRVQTVQVESYTPSVVRVRGVATGARVVAAGAQKLHAGLAVVALERTGSGADWAAQP